MKVYSFRAPENLVKDFQVKYPWQMSAFIKNALIFALQSRNNFNLVLSASDEKTDKED